MVVVYVEEMLSQGSLKNILIAIVIVIIANIIAVTVIRGIKKGIRRTKNNIRYKVNRQLNNMLNIGGVGIGVNDIKQVLSAVNEARDEPEVKSIGGYTSMYLSKIQKDFPNYHNDTVENTIEEFIKEYLDVIYGRKSEFSSNVSDRLKGKISKEKSGSVSNVKFNGIAIYNYTKTGDYASVLYRISVGYNENSTRIETRYEVEYSYGLSKGASGIEGLVCPNCGGTYDSISDTKCPYCGALVNKDTYMNWLVTNIKEI